MGYGPENQPFKNREHAKAVLKAWASFGDICQFLCFVFAALGVIGGLFSVLNLFYIMLLLTIATGINAIIGHMHVAVTKHLLGIEAESKKQD